jgi:hypothetical protein
MVLPDHAPTSPFGDGARQALVCFEHRPGRGVLRLLRPGFRHCFCLLRAPRGWLVCDPLKRGLVLELLPDLPIEALVRHYLATGRHVTVGRACRGPAASGPALRPLTCVEVVKRAIGVPGGLAPTPWRLFRRLVEVEGWRGHHPTRTELLDMRP